MSTALKASNGIANLYNVLRFVVVGIDGSGGRSMWFACKATYRV